ncbi:hypothetical protein niasHS_001057 [Heterodera schachtii]|uniref:Uncharacterized protein n=1 Tax=Heterodera schachtii TaxID=97005 RepID=A0ABD2K932_HETSC
MEGKLYKFRGKNESLALQGRRGAEQLRKRREERKAQTKSATEARLAKKNTPQPNLDAEMPQQDEAGPSTSAALAEEAMDPPPPTPGPVPTPEMDEELLEFGFSLPSTPATPIGDLVPFPSTPIAPMDIGEMTPPPLVIDDRSERIEQLEMELKDRDDTIQFLREQVRNRDALITALRRQLEQCAPPPTATPTTSKTTPTGRPKKNVDHLQRSSRRKLADQIADKSQRQQSEAIDAADGLLILCLVGTQKAYERLKRTFRLINSEIDFLPPLKKVLVIKQQICAHLHYQKIETAAGVGFVCLGVKAALEFRLNSAKDNLISFDDELLIKLSGDHGQGFTKLTISFGQALRNNSASNHFIAAVFPAKDSRENLEQYGALLWPQIDQMNALINRPIKFLGGDVSFVWALIGHCGSAVTSFPSPICNCHRDQLLTEGQQCQTRTIMQTTQQSEQFAKAVENGEKATAAVRSSTMGIVKAPLMKTIEFDRIIPAPFHVLQGLGNALVRELEQQTDATIAVQQFLRQIGARREQFRKKDMTGNTIRKVLKRASEMEHLFESTWPKTICQALMHLGQIQNFTKAQPLSPNDLDAFEDKIEEFRAFLVQEQRMREFLSQKPKAHLLLNHFVPFARQHSFLGLLDEQGDEALHSVWRRLEQWWKCMPDADQILQQLEHHFVSNWLLDTGRIAEMKQRLEDQKEDENFLEHSDGENDEGSVIDVVG